MVFLHQYFHFYISIHSLRMEGDFCGCQSPHAGEDISIHSLRMEGDLSCTVVFCKIFHFNPLPPHGGRLYTSGNITDTRYISIHSLRMEGDSDNFLICTLFIAFQSTPSAWRETNRLYLYYISAVFQSTPSAWRETTDFVGAWVGDSISIHSLRMEGDIYIYQICTF